MGKDFYDVVFDSFVENISSVASPQDEEAYSQQNGMQLPQHRYGKGAGRDHLDNQNLVMFVRQDGSFIPVPAAVNGDHTDLVSRDLPALGEAGFTITLRFELLGYPPQEFQLRTFDWCKPPKRITLSKLSTEVAKVVQRLIERLQGQTIAPEHAKWRVGPNGIQAKDLRIAALEQVSVGSWQPRLFYKPEL